MVDQYGVNMTSLTITLRGENRGDLLSALRELNYDLPLVWRHESYSQGGHTVVESGRIVERTIDAGPDEHTETSI